MNGVELLKQVPGTDDEKTLTLLDAYVLQITSKMDALRQGRKPHDHSEWNWASEIHHPCLKNLTHCRRDWENRQIMDLHGVYRTEEGQDQEWKIKKWLGDVGCELSRSQESFTWERYKIKGKIDGMLPIDIRDEEGNQIILPGEYAQFKEAPTEVKSIGPQFWNSTKTIEELKGHKKFWINKIPSQLNLYLVMSGIPFGFIILKTWGKKARILPMMIDYDLAELDISKAEKVNAHYEAGTYPEPMPFDATVCAMCDFNHICQPLKAQTNLVEISEIDEVELELYLELEDQKKQAQASFNEMEEKLIGDEEKPGKYFGKNAISGAIEIVTKTTTRKSYPGIPLEVKKPYEKENTKTKTTIRRINQ
ncbi:MAG: hypothetical protein JSW41_02590 [Candidatus Aenigmatarchaeota archaeon]|nr:MAG: hypothetical protein JSW41_02590 [Candidatus Aenigmarchaeota archaeon]